MVQSLLYFRNTASKYTTLSVKMSLVVMRIEIRGQRVDYEGDVHDDSPMFAIGEAFEYEGLRVPGASTSKTMNR
jgi:hypothetical protein